MVRRGAALDESRICALQESRETGGAQPKVVVALDVMPTPQSHPTAEAMTRSEHPQRVSQGSRRARFDDESSLTVAHGARDGADIGGHHGSPAGHRFEDDVR